MTKSPSEYDDGELPLFKALGVETPDELPAQLGYVRGFLAVTTRQYGSLSRESQIILDNILTDLALGIGNKYLMRATKLVLEEELLKENDNAS